MRIVKSKLQYIRLILKYQYENKKYCVFKL